MRTTLFSINIKAMENSVKNLVDSLIVGSLVRIAPFSDTMKEKSQISYEKWYLLSIHKKEFVLKDSSGKTRIRKKTSLAWEVQNSLAII